MQTLASVAYGFGTDTIVPLPYSRAQESEADQSGLVDMAQAGYDPQSAVQFWQRFMQNNAQQGGSGCRRR